MKRIWDISPPIDENAAVFPGDTAYSQRLHFSLSPDCPVNVNSITLSPHTGAHADAPLHYAAGGATAGALGLEPYLGRCRVIHCLDSGPLVRPGHVAHAMQNLPARVLIRTSRAASQDWGSFTALAGETIAYLATHSIANKLLLVGLDTPSVDPATSQTLPSHQMLQQLDLRVLENLVLDDVPEGDYELIALPLKLTRADASPVRAILRAL
ncbi:MAG: arylformamidase [Burkholderiaceae bacterium]|nr:arylformamidase [Burkholderiaceae bacterium]